jgi:hypothetical protein
MALSCPPGRSRRCRDLVRAEPCPWLERHRAVVMCLRTVRRALPRGKSAGVITRGRPSAVEAVFLTSANPAEAAFGRNIRSVSSCASRRATPPPGSQQGRDSLPLGAIQPPYSSPTSAAGPDPRRGDRQILPEYFPSPVLRPRRHRGARRPARQRRDRQDAIDGRPRLSAPPRKDWHGRPPGVRVPASYAFADRVGQRHVAPDGAWDLGLRVRRRAGRGLYGDRLQAPALGQDEADGQDRSASRRLMRALPGR